MKIPRIIHQTWRTNNIPIEFKGFQHSWQANHPTWQYQLWTDEMNRRLIKDYFPEFLPIYDGYGTPIQRVDAVRYFALYNFGGVYIDMDFECYRNISSLLGDNSCLFGQEPDEHCKWHNKDMIISNAFMACTPRNPFFKLLCDELTVKSQPGRDKNNDILETTGPFMLTRVYKRLQEKERPSVLSHDLLYPLTKTEIDSFLSEKKYEKIQHKLDKAYGMHYYWGSWWGQNKGRLSKF